MASIEDVRRGTRAANPEVRLVRNRLGLAIVATFAVGNIIGCLEVTVLAPGFGSILAQLVALAPLPGFLVVAAAFFLSLSLLAWLARFVVRPAERLGDSWRELGQRLESARTSALEDSLTGLPNHRAFQEAFERQLAIVERTARPLALLLIDLDEFKAVNDTRGHAAGDEQLCEMGRTLRRTLRGSDLPFRIGGDEFAVLMPDTDAESGSIVGNRLLAACLGAGTSLVVRRSFAFSAGVTAAPTFGMARDQLFMQADDALYRAKRDGRCCVRVHNPAEAKETQERESNRSGAVAEVIRSGGLRPVYQPIVDLATGETVGFEGLIRLPAGTPFTDPGHLFRAAEATGYTFDLDRACIAAVLEGAMSIDRSCSLSVNLSPRTIEAAEFSAYEFAGRLVKGGWNPNQVIVEMTEQDEIRDVERLRAMLERLRDLGIRTAIDDVGSGNAGLRLLSLIRFDVVKLDLALVQEGARREVSMAVVNSLGELAAQWGARIIAEGIETPAQLSLLRRAGIPLGQGYLLGRPSAMAAHGTLDLDALERPPDIRQLGLPQAG
jgi:diguanylate cyclase (GGDEF)-like protein